MPMEFENSEKKVPVSFGDVSSKKGPLDGTVRPLQQTVFKPAMQTAAAAKPGPSKEKDAAEKKSTTVRIFEILISVSFGALFFGLPLFFLGKTFQGIIFEKQIYFYFWGVGCHHQLVDQKHHHRRI